MDGTVGQRPGFVFAIIVLATLAAAMLALPQPASANHGYQTYGLKNKVDKKVDGVILKFDREISHVEEHTWDRAKCSLLDRSDRVAYCNGGRPLGHNDGVTISVATPPPPTSPPPYVEANLKRWYWTDDRGRSLGDAYAECKKPECRYFGTTVPARPVGRPAGP
jgi:hypothetical protein